VSDRLAILIVGCSLASLYAGLYLWARLGK
jgi:hypothetical protein